MPPIKGQNIFDFIKKPMGSSIDIPTMQNYSNTFKKLNGEGKIHINATCQIEDSYYFHIKVPSESQTTNGKDHYYYDVVIRFYSDNENVLNGGTLTLYNVQFYSNSPSFMYTYAYIYKQNSMLIETLYDKLDPEYIDVPPTKTNPTMKRWYDKSIYLACEYLIRNEFKYLRKGFYLDHLKRVKSDTFFREISDFKSIKLDQALMNEEKKLRKNITDEGKRKAQRNINKIQKVFSTHKGNGETSSIRIIKKRNGGQHVMKKIGGKKTTRK